MHILASYTTNYDQFCVIPTRIDENFVLKVADFGLSEDIYARNYFRQTGLQNSEGEASVKLPVRWMALESLHDGIFTEKTDVVTTSYSFMLLLKQCSASLCSGHLE